MRRLKPSTLPILLLAVALPSASQAQARCPWLNAATAAGVLGGEAQSTIIDPPKAQAAQSPMYSASDQQIVRRKDQADTSCEFRRQVNSAIYSLNITVKTLADPAKDFAAMLSNCSGKVTLTAIGNEAFQCSPAIIGNQAATSQEQVIARVRSRAFILTIDHAQNKPVLQPGSPLRPETRNVAEQVAGSLF